MRLEWNETLSVGNTMIDNQHKELINRINALVEAMSKGKGKEEVSKVVDFLGSYIIKHFTSEEALMQRFNYPDVAAHKREHTAFVEDFKKFKAEFQKTGTSSMLAIRAQKWLSTWLFNHISKVDRMLASFLKKSA